MIDVIIKQVSVKKKRVRDEIRRTMKDFFEKELSP